MAFGLHQSVKMGDIERVQLWLGSPHRGTAPDINDHDWTGRTPLMHAVSSPDASVDLVRLLLERGADIHQITTPLENYPGASVMELALRGGDPQKVRLLLEHSADIHYRNENGYNALINAVCGRDTLRDKRLLDLLRLLIEQGVDLNGVTSHRESALRVLSRLGRFDAIALLLDAGADPSHLEWTPLYRAIALGSLDQVRAEIERDPALDNWTDWWERTPWLLAIQTGDIAKAALLRESGANIHAKGRCGKPPLFYAIENHHAPMLRWLLEIGLSVEERDEFGDTALMIAAEAGDGEIVNILLAAGATVNAMRGECDQTALGNAQTREVAAALLAAEADPRQLSFEGRRALVGLPPDPDESLLDISEAEFQAGRARRFGISNPELCKEPFWESMIRAGITGWQAAQRFEKREGFNRPAVWCAQRFGQSITFLPDGRIIQIAGEHEDHYDPDFCIYNDVFVHELDGTIRIYGYPAETFPPTDFHTATRLEDSIYIIGSLGYSEARQYGTTPVYRLDTRSFQMERIATEGTAPGWIHKHRATLVGAGEIRVTGGAILMQSDRGMEERENTRTFILDVEQRRWRVEDDGARYG